MRKQEMQVSMQFHNRFHNTSLRALHPYIRYRLKMQWNMYIYVVRYVLSFLPNIKSVNYIVIKFSISYIQKVLFHSRTQGKSFLHVFHKLLEKEYQ